MLDNGDLILDNPNTPTNQNLHIFKKPFPNHTASSNQTSKPATNDNNVHEFHDIFKFVPALPQFPPIPFI